MLGIAFNLVMGATYVSVKVNAKLAQIGEFTGSSGDPSGGRFAILESMYNISSFIAFFSIWLTTAIIMNKYREKLLNVILYWVLLTIPIIYFAVTFFYQYTLSAMLTPYMQVDPVTVSIFLGAFLSLSKPIGGLVFGAAFWNISRSVKYDRKIRSYMIISGWGIFLIFATNQAVTQIVSPYPPFGLATITVLNVAGYLMLLGIYNSASLVSTNNSLRKYIRRHALLKSNLLDLIGHAEMEKEIQETVTEVIESQEIQDIRTEREVELDENEIRRYIDLVIKEVKMKGTNGSV
jgi:glucan phosphoethanolaminetransferase (alkaline phosphatase superfamily)